MIRAQTLLFALPRFDIAATLSTWAAIARQRRDLANLDATALADLGLSAEMAKQEAKRPFWDAPDNWRI